MMTQAIDKRFSKLARGAGRLPGLRVQAYGTGSVSASRSALPCATVFIDSFLLIVLTEIETQ